MKLVSNSKSPFEFTGYVLDKEIKQDINPDNNGIVKLKMAPWELCIFKQAVSSK